MHLNASRYSRKVVNEENEGIRGGGTSSLIIRIEHAVMFHVGPLVSKYCRMIIAWMKVAVVNRCVGVDIYDPLLSSPLRLYAV